MKIKCIDNYGCCYLIKNKIYEVNNENDCFYYIMNERKEKMGYFKYRFEVVKEYKGKKIKCQCHNTKEQKREFNFTLPSIRAYLRNEWKTDLTKKNPLIVVRIDGYTDYMIHESIMYKANKLKIKLPLLNDTDKDISILTEWVKMIKSLPWKDKKVSIKVIVPKI